MLTPAYLAALQKLCCTKPRAAGVSYGDLKALAALVESRRLITPTLGGTKREISALVLPVTVAGAMPATGSLAR
jgi:hypothetical protein